MEPRLYFGKVGSIGDRSHWDFASSCGIQCPLRHRAGHGNMGTVVTQWKQGSVLTERGNMEHKGQGNIARYTRNITVADQGLMVSRRSLCHHRISWKQQ